MNVLDKQGIGKCEKNRGRVVCMSASNLNNLKFAKNRGDDISKKLKRKRLL